MKKRTGMENMLGYDLKVMGIETSVRQIKTWVDSPGKPRAFFCLNPHSIVEAMHDRQFRTALHSADLLTPDGAGILLASKFLGGAVKERVTGSDVFGGLNHLLNQSYGSTYSCFFLGSSDKTLELIRKRMAVDYPEIRVAGTYSPPYKPAFSEQDSQKMIQAVNKVAPDILWVGMTAPKQEKWIHQHKHLLNVKFIGAIGAVFDFYVGNVRRSHPIFQKMGLEWLPRLIQEPRRLFKRNFVSSPVFLFHVFRQKYAGKL